MTARAPQVPLWLMERLLSASNHDALIGDICEQHAHGHSRLWFWRQSLVAIAFDAARTIRDYKFLAVRAFIIGYSALILLQVLNLGGWTVATAVQVGLIKSQMWASARNIFLILITLQFVAAGWIVGRFHRPRPGAFVLGVAALLLLFATPELLRTLLNALQDERFGSYFWSMALSLICQFVGFVLGGTLSTVREHSEYPAAHLRIRR